MLSVGLVFVPRSISSLSHFFCVSYLVRLGPAPRIPLAASDPKSSLGEPFICRCTVWDGVERKTIHGGAAWQASRPRRFAPLSLSSLPSAGVAFVRHLRRRPQAPRFASSLSLLLQTGSETKYQTLAQRSSQRTFNTLTSIANLSRSHFVIPRPDVVYGGN